MPAAKPAFKLLPLSACSGSGLSRGVDSVQHVVHSNETQSHGDGQGDELRQAWHKRDS